MHVCEIAGRDIRCGKDNYWRSITGGRLNGRKYIEEDADVLVDAGSIQHRGTYHSLIHI